MGILTGIVAAGALFIAQWPGAGITVFFEDQPGDPPITMAMDRAMPGEGWIAVDAHEGYQGQHEFDYRLIPGTTVRLRARAGDAEVMHDLNVENDMAYVAFASIGPDDPTSTCMGCSPVVSAPLPGGDRLWLFTSFNGINSVIHF